MIVVEFFRKNDEITGFEISGHAGFDQYGRDIACASVSSAVMMTANLITDVFGYDAAVEVKDSDNNSIVLKALASGDAVLQKLFEGLVMHITLLSQEFDGTIKITFTEV